MMADLTQSYRKSGDAVTRAIAGETLLVPIRGRLADLRRIYSLNPVAARVWDLIDGVRDVAALRDEVVAAFDVEPEQATADVDVFLEQLLEAGLVSTEVDSTSTGSPAAGGEGALP